VRQIGWIFGLAVALGGCASTDRVAGTRPAEAPRVQSVTYATTPCHGFCPVYSVTIGRNGAGLFTGIRNTAVSGERRFNATPAQAADFVNRLQPYLPTGELLLNGPESCKTYASDLPSVDVRWSGNGGSGHLLYDLGCDREEHRALSDALRAAPKALPIAELTGER
jgi:hypothetical protein